MPLQITGEITLAEITPQVIEDLLRHDVDEDVYFDFKEGPDSKDPKSIHNIRKAIASFANTFGGFLFFGILDKGNTNKQGLDRLVDLSNTTELGKRITQKYLGRDLCVPTVYFEGPSLLTVQNKTIGVIKIPRSNSRPHAVKDATDRPLEFWTRGAGTTHPMDYSHLLSEVDRSREERGWLLALYQDLETLTEHAANNANYGLGGPTGELANKYHSVVTSNTGDILRVLGGDTRFVQLFLPLKDSLYQANDLHEQATLLTATFHNPSTTNQLRGHYNLRLGHYGQLIETQARQLRDYLLSAFQVVRERATTQL